MIGLDTNLLVRIIVDDDADQRKLVTSVLERCQAEGTKCLVTLIVLAELEWVLEKSYGASRTDIAAAIRGLLDDRLFAIEERAAVELALENYREGRGDLSDYLVGFRGHLLGAQTTMTFDKKLRAAPPFTLLQADQPELKSP